MKMEELWDFGDSYSTDTSEHLSQKVKKQFHPRNKNLQIQISPTVSRDSISAKDFEIRVSNISKFLGFV